MNHAHDHVGFALGAWGAHERIVRAALRADDLPTLLDALYVDLTNHDREWWASSGLPAEIIGRRQVLLHDLCERLAGLRGLDHWPVPGDLLPACPDSPALLTRGGAP